MRKQSGAGQRQMVANMRFQFGCRLLLVVVGVCCALLATISQTIRHEIAAVEALSNKGCKIERSWSHERKSTRFSEFLREQCGLNWVESSLDITCRGPLSTKDWEQFESLRCVGFLSVYDHNLSDDAMRILSRQRNLKSLFIYGPNSVTDDGIRCFRTHREITTICLEGCEITDASVDCLAQLKSLEWVSLRKTRVSEAGIKRLQLARPDMVIVTGKS